jgi:hypothetical protein
VAVEAGLEVEEVADEVMIEQAPVVSVDAAFAGVGREMVYFLGNGSRIKIGYTTNLAGRIAALSLGRESVLLVLAGGRPLERALHRWFGSFRVRSTEWFNDSVVLRHFVSSRQQFRAVGAPVLADHVSTASTAHGSYQTGLTYPDGSVVPRREWPDLYRVFEALCAEEGCATKEALTEKGPFESRDTVRRALQVWLDHGVQVRKAGRVEEFYLPAAG